MIAEMNEAYLRRSQARGNATPHVLGSAKQNGLGEYVTDLRYRTLQTRGADGQGNIGGPLSYPVIPAAQEMSVQGWLQRIAFLLEQLPMAMSLEWRTRFIMQPRESLSFLVGSGDVSVPAGAAVAIVTETTDERFTGFLTDVGMNVIAPGSFSSIVWQIRVNGAIHPKFANRVFSASSLSTLYPFAFELSQSRTVQLVAINTAGVPITVQGVMAGWTEFMADFKSYGSSPATGVQ